MSLFDIPTSFHNAAKSYEGFLLPADPPADVEGWVVVIAFHHSVTGERVREAEFFFVVREDAKQFMQAVTSSITEDQRFGECKVAAITLTDSKDLYFCSFCGSRRQAVRHLIQGLKGSICDGCVKHCSEEIAQREKRKD
jgi:ClpX C4-type zinc finger